MTHGACRLFFNLFYFQFVLFSICSIFNLFYFQFVLFVLLAQFLVGPRPENMRARERERERERARERVRTSIYTPPQAQNYLLRAEVHVSGGKNGKGEWSKVAE
jgi:hypothetical protein